MSLSDFHFRLNGDSAITLIFEDKISKSLTKNILILKNTIIHANDLPRLIDIIPAYQSLTLCYAYPIKNVKTIENQISNIIANIVLSDRPSALKKQKVINIPVCYEDTYAPDLKMLASELKMTTNQLIKKHTDGIYLVHMLGFLPGFLYLGGLDESLHYPRKKTPSINLAKGSIGIGGQQTGIYPIESPGGWNIIGRTPLTMFDVDKEKITIAEPLDSIKFYSISSAEFIKFNIQSQN